MRRDSEGVVVENNYSNTQMAYAILAHSTFGQSSQKVPPKGARKYNPNQIVLKMAHSREKSSFAIGSVMVLSSSNPLKGSNIRYTHKAAYGFNETRPH